MAPNPFPQELQASYHELRCNLAWLTPDEIAQARLDNGWTPKALLAHVAFWDDFQGRRMTALHRDQPPPSFPTADNEQRAAQDDHRPWAEIMAAADDARQRLIDLADGLSADDLAREHESGDRTITLGGVLAHMVRHTYGHTHDIIAFCGSLQRWTRTGLRRFIVQQHLTLLDSIGGLHEETILGTQVCGTWTIRDVLAHVLTWNQFEVAVLKSWPTPKSESLAAWLGQNGEDSDAINARLLAACQEMDLIAIADGLATEHRRILKRFDKATDDDLSSLADVGWDTPRTLSCFVYELALHDLEHAEQIWRYRAEVGKK